MKSNDMKIYCNERLGFEINVPSEWPLPNRVTDGLMFNLGYNECFYIQVLELVRQPNPKQAEMLFIQLAHDLGYTDLEYGRISVRDKQCVSATYNVGYGFWAKKYIISICLIEYVLTAGFPSRQALFEKEHSFDEIVKSFRLTESGELCLHKMEAKSEALFGPSYEKAYQAVSEERFSDARVLLEQCIIHENPDHVFARKELAIVLRHLGDIEGAIQHRREVKRLDPSDGVNRFNLAGLLNIIGEKQESLYETEELLAMEPSNPILQAHKSRLIDNRLWNAPR